MAKRTTRKKSRKATTKKKKAITKVAKKKTAATLLRGVVAGAVVSVTSKVVGDGGKPDAIEILEREHRHFEALLKEGEETTERARATRRELLTTLTADLNAHELMEEKVLYPALQDHPQAREIVLEGFEEHHVADLILKELHDVATDDEAWGAKFKVLKESIEHHIKEEESNMFRLARGIFSRDELRALGARMLKIRP